jgi:serine/threonine protein kinase
MKIINKEYLSKQAPLALSNQLQEIKLLRHLQHANIISMRECLSRGSHVYIVLEFCSFNLDELLQDQVEGKFHVSIARRYFYQLCSAVNYLHSLGVVHRDIKPQNMLLTNCGNLKLIDFGVSHVLSMWDRNDLCTNYEGSPLFQAPEIVVGGREYRGFKADVWSCGVTLYLMLYGQYPFIDEALLGLYDKILAEDVVIPSHDPTTMALTDLLVSMLDKDCSKRADIGQVLEHPWLKLLGASNECDEMQYSEFFDLVIKRHDDHEKWSKTNANSQPKDMYKSMTVLPYLYRHHFPDLPIRKSRCNSSCSNDSDLVITRINPLDSSSESNLENVRSSRSSSTTNSDTSTPSSRDANPHDIVDDDSQHIEWGTRTQYHLMKVPQIRANRIRCGLSTRTKEKKRKSKKTKDRTDQ